MRDLGLSVDTDRVLTVSIGLAEAHGDDDLDALVRRADRAMYRAKDSGGDRVELAVHRPGTPQWPHHHVAPSLPRLSGERSG